MSLFDAIKSMEEKLSFKKRAVVGGIAFEITLLNYEQDQLISSIPEENDSPLSYYDRTRAQVLSYAITSINDEKIPEIIEVKDGDKSVTKERSIYIREILKKLPPKLIDKIFEVYVDFKDEMDTKLEGDVQYEWYKTPEQRKKERESSVAESDEQSDEESVGEKEEEKPIVFTEISVKDDEDDKVE
jgi:hypothetical protein